MTHRDSSQLKQLKLNIYCIKEKGTKLGSGLVLPAIQRQIKCNIIFLRNASHVNHILLPLYCNYVVIYLTQHQTSSLFKRHCFIVLALLQIDLNLKQTNCVN